MEWIEYEASLCKGCGHPRDECFDEANTLSYEAVPLQCKACAERDRTAKARTQQKKTTDGMYYAVTHVGG